MTDTATSAATRTKPEYPAARPKVPPFARYEGTSAFRKDRRRAREYARYRASLKQSAASSAA